MKWQDAKLNTDGEDLIYEESSDNPKLTGDPLDIIAVVTVDGGETVLGVKFPPKKMAKELCTRWNCFQELLAACVAVVETDGYVGSAIMRSRIDAMKAAIDAVKKESERV